MFLLYVENEKKIDDRRGCSEKDNSKFSAIRRKTLKMRPPTHGDVIHTNDGGVVAVVRAALVVVRRVRVRAPPLLHAPKIHLLQHSHQPRPCNGH